MAFKSLQLVLTTTQQRLSDAYGSSAKFPAGTPNPALDVPYRQLVFYAEAAAAFIGADNAVSTTVFGITLASGASVSYGQVDSGPLKLSDFFAVGNGCTLHISGLPF